MAQSVKALACRSEVVLGRGHHRARTAIANLLRNRGWEVHEEIHCVSEDDSHRRVDIIAINRRTQKAMVLDPTVCFERDTNQALQINDDKRAKYVPCLPYLSEKYGISLYNWDVAGLLFGARGLSRHPPQNEVQVWAALKWEHSQENNEQPNPLQEKHNNTVTPPPSNFTVDIIKGPVSTLLTPCEVAFDICLSDVWIWATARPWKPSLRTSRRTVTVLEDPDAVRNSYVMVAVGD
ncbi:hypothetical protein ANN_21371 [Periplaneta americana]|uniref:Uncharacterized protein n=1 Tax=Periplaneta americana TaxID=6978 RepID=A0ABQ8SF41_PERAM|nr:hypothetical protein ANN_21371 [Periplaneta americana]